MSTARSNTQGQASNVLHGGRCDTPAQAMAFEEAEEASDEECTHDEVAEQQTYSGELFVVCQNEDCGAEERVS